MHSHRLRRLPALLVLFALGLAAFGPVLPVHASGTLIPAPYRVDVAFDTARGIVYISSGSQVLRYQVSTASFLAPFNLGGSLLGLDLSPDGNTLAVADASSTPDPVGIFLVDLTTGASRRVSFTPASGYEGGTFSVAFGSDGYLLVSSRFNGSGWVPLRKYNPATGETTVLYSVRQDTMLTASADRSIIGFAESNISDGRWGRYRVSDGSIVERTGYTDGTGRFNFEIGTSRGGDQFALPTYNGAYIYDANFVKIAAIGTYATSLPIGAAYHPTQDLVYFPWLGTTQVLAYQTKTFTQVASYDAGYMFEWTGNHAYTNGRVKVASDGSALFVTVKEGVQYIPLEPIPVAESQTVQTSRNTAIAITLQAANPSGRPLTYHVLANPLHGMLIGTAPNLTYTPATGYTGADSFTFNVTDGLYTSNTATVTINIPDNPPVANPDTAQVAPGKSVVIKVLANDYDPDGDPLQVISATSPRFGTATINADGTITYRAFSSFKTNDTFAYTISDGRGGTATATVTVNKKK